MELQKLTKAKLRELQNQEVYKSLDAVKPTQLLRDINAEWKRRANTKAVRSLGKNEKD